jgi:multimeric flavodoxin WrbA
MSLLVLNGSPRKKGTVASLPRTVTEGASDKHKVEWIDVYDLKMKPCVAA